jgi:hypothetical protein
MRGSLFLLDPLLNFSWLLAPIIILWLNIITIMRVFLLTVVGILLTKLSFAQPVQGIIEMGKYYRQFMLRNSPPDNVVSSFATYTDTELAYTAKFIKETLVTNNKLLTPEFLNRPNDKDLKYIFIVRQVNYNIRKENPEDNDVLVKELLNKEIPVNELVDAYYSIFFSSVGNKLQPFDLSNVNFEINNYHLKNDTEKGIFFLESMNLNGTTIWGYINIAKPPRYQEALNYINRYPKYNGSLYYQYLDFSFPDFKLKITSEKKEESFKEYYINKFYDTLLNHLISLNKTGADEKLKNDLILGSILKERNYFKYSKYKDILNSIFSEKKL